MKNRNSQEQGVYLFIGGVVMVILLAVLIIWPDFEAAIVGDLLPADQPIGSLDCPIAIGRDEPAEIRARFTNPTDSDLRVRIDSQISQGSLTLTRTDNREVFIEPNGEEELVWEISADDAVYGNMVVGRFFSYRNAQIAAGASNCGIMVINLPFVRGWMVVSLLALGGGGLMGAGLLTVLRGGPMTKARRTSLLQLVILGVAILIPLIVAIAGYPVLALPLAFIPAVVIISLAEHVLNRDSV